MADLLSLWELATERIFIFSSSPIMWSHKRRTNGVTSRPVVYDLPRRPSTYLISFYWIHKFPNTHISNLSGFFSDIGLILSWFKKRYSAVLIPVFFFMLLCRSAALGLFEPWLGIVPVWQVPVAHQYWAKAAVVWSDVEEDEYWYSWPCKSDLCYLILNVCIHVLITG